jgi:hypothetical protein
MKPMAIRSLGAVWPSNPRTEAGKRLGVAKATVADPTFCKKRRREKSPVRGEGGRDGFVIIWFGRSVIVRDSWSKLGTQPHLCMKGKQEMGTVRMINAEMVV